MPVCPDAIRYLWEYFCELDLTRQNFGWGPVAFSYAEIDAWGRLRNVRLDPWELDAILRLDRAFLAVAAKANKGKPG